MLCCDGSAVELCRFDGVYSNGASVPAVFSGIRLWFSRLAGLAGLSVFPFRPEECERASLGLGACATARDGFSVSSLLSLSRCGSSRLLSLLLLSKDGFSLSSGSTGLSLHGLKACPQPRLVGGAPSGAATSSPQKNLPSTQVGWWGA